MHAPTTFRKSVAGIPRGLVIAFLATLCWVIVFALFALGQVLLGPV
jgi:hypothetical protein